MGRRRRKKLKSLDPQIRSIYDQDRKYHGLTVAVQERLSSELEIAASKPFSDDQAKISHEKDLILSYLQEGNSLEKIAEWYATTIPELIQTYKLPREVLIRESQ